MIKVAFLTKLLPNKQKRKQVLPSKINGLIYFFRQTIWVAFIFCVARGQSVEDHGEIPTEFSDPVAFSIAGGNKVLEGAAEPVGHAVRSVRGSASVQPGAGPVRRRGVRHVPEDGSRVVPVAVDGGGQPGDAVRARGLVADPLLQGLVSAEVSQPAVPAAPAHGLRAAIPHRGPRDVHPRAPLLLRHPRRLLRSGLHLPEQFFALLPLLPRLRLRRRLPSP